MKKAILAILPFILVAQIPLNRISHFPSEWMKSVQVGLKWTELMLNGYPGAEPSSEKVPEGEVTTTIVIAPVLPDIEEVNLRVEDALCGVELQKAIHKEAKKQRMIAVRRVNILL